MDYEHFSLADSVLVHELEITPKESVSREYECRLTILFTDDNSWRLSDEEDDYIGFSLHKAWLCAQLNNGEIQRATKDDLGEDRYTQAIEKIVTTSGEECKTGSSTNVTGAVEKLALGAKFDINREELRSTGDVSEMSLRRGFIDRHYGDKCQPKWLFSAHEKRFLKDRYSRILLCTITGLQDKSFSCVTWFTVDQRHVHVSHLPKRLSFYIKWKSLRTLKLKKKIAEELSKLPQKRLMWEPLQHAERSE